MNNVLRKTPSVTIITGIVGSLFSIFFLGIAKPVLANGDISFFCGEYEGEPATFLVTPRVEKPIIVWAYDDFVSSGYTPEVRCSMNTYNFNKSYADGNMPVLTTGWMGENPDYLWPVICTTDKKGGECQELLYTLKSNQDPDDTLARLTGLDDDNETQAKIKENLLFESKCSPKLYVNINKNNGNLKGKYACEGQTGILPKVSNLFNNLASFVQELF